MANYSPRRLAAAFLACVVFALGAPSLAQSAASEVSPASEAAAEPANEALLPIGEAAPAENGTAPSTAGTLFALFRIVLVLALLCAGLWGLFFFLKKSTGINVGDDPYLKSVASLPLGASRSVQVVTLGARAFMLGVTDQSVSLISEVDDRELIDAMNLAADKTTTARVGGFQAILSAFMPQKRGENLPSDFGAELIRRQRERLNKSVDGESNR